MSRSLTMGETALARRVFGDAVRLDRVRIYGGGFGPFVVTIGRRLFFPPGLASGDFAAAGRRAQALLVHELVHVWQFQTRPLWTLASWLKVLLGGGYGPGLPGYRYAEPVEDFARLNLEQQASVVEHAFLRGDSALAAAAPFPLSER